MDVMGIFNVVFLLLPSWIYFRIIVLPFWTLNLLFNPLSTYPPHLSEFDAFPLLNGIYLLVLQILHIYWTFLILNMLCRYVKTGVTKDTQEDFIPEDKSK